MLSWGKAQGTASKNATFRKPLIGLNQQSPAPGETTSDMGAVLGLFGKEQPIGYD